MAAEDSTHYANPAADSVPSTRGVVAVPIDATPPKDATPSATPPVAWPAQPSPPGVSRTKRVLQMTWVKDFRAFAGETSAHGVKNIFEGPSKVIKMLFLLCWVVASIYSCYIIISSIVKYSNIPTSTKFEVRVDPPKGGNTQSIKFPTITVCSHNKIKKSYLDNPDNVLLKEYHEIIDMYDKEETKALIERFADPEDAMQSVVNVTFEELIAAGGPEGDRLLMCSQRADNCFALPEMLNHPVYTMETSITGTCWRINPDGRMRGKMGDYGNMKLLFWADVQDYGLRAADFPAVGFTVAFHDSTAYGSTSSSGFLMSPGTYYKADLRLKEEYREPPPGGQCDPLLVNTTYGAYGEGACILMCKDDYLNDTCGCVNVTPPLNNGTYESCTLKEWAECGAEAYLDWFQNFTDPNRAEAFCPCATACVETRYEAQVSSSSVSRPYAENLLPNVMPYLQAKSDPAYNISYSTVNDILDNLMVVDVLFTSMQKSEIREIVTYGFANLLGDIGGVLGLFLGASIFTILEFFQFLLFSLNKHCCGMGKDKEGTKDDEEKDML